MVPPLGECPKDKGGATSSEEAVSRRMRLLTDEELSKSVIWLTTPIQQRSKSEAIG